MANITPTNIRIPPESTGPKVATESRTVVEFDNLTGNFNVKDIVVGAVSGATGTVTSVVTTGTTSGRLYLSDFSGTFNNNENIEVLSTPQAVVNTDNFTQIEQQTQHIVITDPNNPEFQQRIDRFGATVNTFSDGSPLFGPFGGMVVGEQQTIKDYRFAYTEGANEFWDLEDSGATITYESSTSNMLFTNPTTSGAIASRTSNFYHPYIPGVGNLLEITLDVGDLGKANVTRRWGLFDDDNGVFWELEGTTLYVVIRSNTSGSPVDTRVAQSNFNQDKLDGTDAIGLTLDITKGNIYFIDFQWLGAGRVRFGVVEPSGARVNAHIVENANVSDIPYMRTATLPVRIEQINTGTSGSTSELRWTCASVKHSSKAEIERQRFSASTEANLLEISGTDGERPVVSIRPRKTFNGLVNRGLIKLQALDLLNDGDSQSVIFRVRQGAVLGNTSFGNVNPILSIVESDVGANTVSGGLAIGQQYLSPSSSRLAVINDGSVAAHELEFGLGADANTQPTVTVTAQVIGTGTCNVGAVFNWGESIL